MEKAKCGKKKSNWLKNTYLKNVGCTERSVKLSNSWFYHLLQDLQRCGASERKTPYMPSLFIFLCLVMVQSFDINTFMLWQQVLNVKLEVAWIDGGKNTQYVAVLIVYEKHLMDWSNIFFLSPRESHQDTLQSAEKPLCITLLVSLSVVATTTTLVQ